MSNPRRILLCATGLSPQIVTETLYALVVHQHWIPDEIHLITTTEGRQRAELTLLDADPEQRMFYRLCEDYGIDATAIRFNTDTLHLIGHDAPLDDIRSPEDNERAADTITAVVRELTADPDSQVHASIAGGRKTMGFYLGYAMSLFGRAQDRLSHVLVSAPFESHPQFFFPPRQPRVLYDRSDRPVRTDQAQIILADIPFVRLRDGLSEVICQGGASFSEAVNQAQRALAPPTLVIDLTQRRINCGGIVVTLPPVDFAFYHWLAQRRIRNQPGVCRNQITPEDTAEFLAAYPATDELSGGYERIVEAMGACMEQAYFDSRRSRVNKALREALGSSMAHHYRIHSEGCRPLSRYALGLEAGQIRVVG